MVSPLAYIHPEAKIGENVEIAPFVFIDKNVVIGDNNIRILHDRPGNSGIYRIIKISMLVHR